MTRRQALLFFLLILLLRVGIAAQFRGNFDSASFWIVSEATLRGENVYATTDRYNYSPLWSWIVTGLWKASGGSASLFLLEIGLFLTACDVVASVLVFRIARRRLELSEEEARRAALLFFGNPVSVLISSAHGQFDGLSILFLLAALARFRPRDSAAGEWSVAGLLSLSLLVKHVTLFHPLLFWRALRSGGLAAPRVAAAYALFLASFLPYLAALERILQNVFLYPARLAGNRLQYPVGLHAFARATMGDLVSAAILVLGVAWTIRAVRRVELPRASLVLLLAVFALSPSFSAQYLVWPVALGSLYPSLALGIFSGIAALHHSFQSLHLGWPVEINPLGAWAAGVAWFAVEVAAVRTGEATPAARLRVEGATP